MATMVRRPSLALIFLVCLLPLAALFSFSAARSTPAVHNADKKDKECSEEGTVLIPGVGRYALGSHELPSVSGLDNSIPAAANAHYLPGADDTFVPNPGFEVPNPFQGAGIP